MKEYTIVDKWNLDDHLDNGWRVEQVIPKRKEIIEYEYVLVKEQK